MNILYLKLNDVFVVEFLVVRQALLSSLCKYTDFRLNFANNLSQIESSDEITIVPTIVERYLIHRI